MDGSAPAGLEAWFASQCPSGSRVGVTSAESGELLGAVDCDDLRERALADAPARARLLDAYSKAPSVARSTGDEQVGEAKDPLVFGPFVCAFIAMMPGLVFNVGPTGQVGCHNPKLSHEEQTRCSNLTEGGSAGLGLACALVTIFF
jgi:hypothetical protein